MEKSVETSKKIGNVI